MTLTKTGLVLIHPGASEQPEQVVKAKEDATADGVQVTGQYLINKLNDGSVTLEDENYDDVRYVTPEDPDVIKFPPKLIGVIARALKVGGRFYGLSDLYKVDALINGFEVSSPSGPHQRYYWTKRAKSTGPVAVPLRGKKTANNGSKPLPSFKRVNSDSPVAGRRLPQFQKNTVQVARQDDLEDEEEEDPEPLSLGATDPKSKYFDVSSPLDDDSIEEDDLVDDNETSEPVLTMITCGKSKTRRRKACKDCTCGLKDAEEEEVAATHQQQSRAVKFSEKELTEIDFTIEGKKVGGCGSCALGDAFRCSGCPYLGLPAFKPGQPLDLTSIGDDL
ncbi:DRE2 (YKR071C) [Zygosaccharomyces parabailii]|nr:DRE2 (YKR071C) [Zygosaccharomyces parabailii]CDH08931.1 related to Fe-S cluster assembly protein DRE2 [Zygosaccharomyces bailii ISA1307]SJM85314.1 related to Fe-S cluster assembly protein DRE2 [Zygosaccharomyces bailii]